MQLAALRRDCVTASMRRDCRNGGVNPAIAACRDRFGFAASDTCCMACNVLVAFCASGLIAQGRASLRCRHS